MPVSSAFAESNRRQSERLRRLAGRLDSAMLGVRLPNGWTVAGALAHVAFPGIGRLRAEGSGYIWVPAVYSNLMRRTE